MEEKTRLIQRLDQARETMRAVLAEIDTQTEIYRIISIFRGAFDVAALSIARRPARYGNLVYIAPLY